MPLRKQGARPAADQPEKMQRRFRCALPPGICRRFVETIGEERDAAHDRVGREHGRRQMPEQRRTRERRHEQQRERRREPAWRRAIVRRFLFADEADRVRLKPSLLVAGDGVGDGIAVDRASRRYRERFDMHERLVAAAVRRDEAEALVVVPAVDSSLMAHAVELCPIKVISVINVVIDSVWDLIEMSVLARFFLSYQGISSSLVCAVSADSSSRAPIMSSNLSPWANKWS